MGCAGLRLVEARSRLRCPSVLFAQVKSVSSAQLFHSSSLYELESCLILLRSEYSCVSICCFARGRCLPSMGAGPPGDACAKRKLSVPPKCLKEALNVRD